jgi:hypothetical protein
MRAIEDENPSLKGVLPKDYARPALNKVMLGELIDLFSNIAMGKETSESLGSSRISGVFVGLRRMLEGASTFGTDLSVTLTGSAVPVMHSGVMLGQVWLAQEPGCALVRCSEWAAARTGAGRASFCGTAGASADVHFDTLRPSLYRDAKTKPYPAAARTVSVAANLVRRFI